MNDELNQIHNFLGQQRDQQKQFEIDTLLSLLLGVVFAGAWKAFFPRNAMNPTARAVNWPFIIAIGVIVILAVAFL